MLADWSSLCFSLVRYTRVGLLTVCTPSKNGHTHDMASDSSRDPATFSLVVFPFLRTSKAVSIGDLTLRSTDDRKGLPSEQATSIQEVAEMLFLQNDLRIQSAACAVIPYMDLADPQTDLSHLMNVQAVIAYRYVLPRHEFGDLFLATEHASLAIFSPGRVPRSLVHPEFHVDSVAAQPDIESDQFGCIAGYVGLYNFSHSFWAATGSRLYGPKPHLTINRYQDLATDFDLGDAARADYRLLKEILKTPESRASSRILRTVRWFNTANAGSSNSATAVVNLAIAFESLFGLPREAKTDRLADAIALLLGRTPRLDVWARQFYEARSQIVHEGYAEQEHFVATDSWKPRKGESIGAQAKNLPLYQTLLSYGRQVFQLCLGTLLVGAQLAEAASLEDKLITNQERFQEMCRVLSDEKTECHERLLLVRPLVAACDQYRYVPEANLLIETMIGVVRLAATTFLECDLEIPGKLKEELRALVNAQKSPDHLLELDAIHLLTAIPVSDFRLPNVDVGEIVMNIINLVWHYVAMHYFWLRRQSRQE